MIDEDVPMEPRPNIGAFGFLHADELRGQAREHAWEGVTRKPDDVFVHSTGDSITIADELSRLMFVSSLLMNTDPEPGNESPRHFTPSLGSS